MDEKDEWYYSLIDGRVVRAEEVRAADRLGPYPDRETAQRALEIAKERTESADRDDRTWGGAAADEDD